MKMLVSTLAAVALIVVTPLSLDAQGVTGRWSAEFDRMVRNENGSVSTGESAKARLTLQQNGDSVTGTLELVDAPAGPAGRAPTPRQLRGTISGNKVSLSSEVEVRRNFNGEESVQRVTMAYDLTLAGDTLEGTMQPMGSDIPPRRFSARREK